MSNTNLEEKSEAKQFYAFDGINLIKTTKQENALTELNIAKLRASGYTEKVKK